MSGAEVARLWQMILGASYTLYLDHLIQSYLVALWVFAGAVAAMVNGRHSGIAQIMYCLHTN